MKTHWALRFTCLSAAAVVIAACGTSTHPAATPATPSASPSTPVSTPAPSPATQPRSPAVPPPAGSTVSTATEVVAYSPYLNDAPRPGLTVSASVSATSCTVALHDLEPLRCIDPTGVIYDPCFPDAAGGSCLYVASPTAATATKVSLGPPSPPQPVTSPPANKNWPGFHPAIPWAIELSDGTMCVFSSGAEETVGGLRPEDGCTDGRFLFGDPTESVAKWTVTEGASQSGPLTGATTIARAWIFAATRAPTVSYAVTPAAGQVGTRAQVPWAQIGTGWFVVTSKTLPDPGTETLWLISPQGGRYRIVSWAAIVQPTGGSIGQAIPIAWSGDGHRVLMSDIGDSGKHEIRLDTGAIRSVGIDNGGYTAPSGTQFVAVHAAAAHNTVTLERVSAAGVVQFVRATMPEQTTHRWLYSSDGTTLYVACATGVVEVNNATGSGRAVLVQRDARWCAPVRWWSRGVILATCENDGGDRLWLVPTNGSSPRQITATPGTGGVSAGLGEIDAVSWGNQIYAQGLRGCGVVGIDRVSSDKSVTDIRVPGSRDNDVLVGAAPAGLAVLSTGECNEGGWFGFFNPTSGVVTTIIGSDSSDGSAENGLAFGSTSWLTG